jgi:hypothetical protein
MLPNSGQESADSAEILGGLEGAKRPADFLLHLVHPNIPFSLIVVKGNREITEEGKRFLFAVFQPINQAPELPPFFPSSSSYPVVHYRIVPCRSAENRVLAGFVSFSAFQRDVPA